MARGRLIVLEGTDGSGKATQTELLTRRLASSGLRCRSISFPRYENPSSALVKMYLSGELGGIGDVNPCAATTFYVADQYAGYRQDWEEFYRTGGIVIADRYATSNLIHQATKLPPEDRAAFSAWLREFAYQRVGLPAPDQVLWLDMPPKATRKMLDDEGKEGDIHEHDQGYLSLCYETAKAVSKAEGWERIPCFEGGSPLPVDVISDIVYATIGGADFGKS